MPEAAKREFLTEATVRKAAALRVPEYAARWAFSIANEIQPANINFLVPGCGHIIIGYCLQMNPHAQVDIIKILDEQEFSDEHKAQAIADLIDARDNRLPQLLAAEAAQPQPGAHKH